ncbi:MAG: ABC-type antimicrobial peptide transport system permease subunit [Roseivirga sp.]|jgi:ABC-type antimicrobial peptide transport system permease subunit
MRNPKNHITPPRLAEKLLTWFIKDDLAEEVLGDLDEKFYSTAEKHSIQKAKRNYWFQVINYLRPFALRSSPFNRIIFSPMKIHFKFAARVFRNNSLISFASLTSIVVGVLSVFLIYLWVDAELSTDKFHSNYSNLYIPVVKQSLVDGSKPASTRLFFNVNYQEFPEIEGVLSTIYFNPDRIKLKYNNQDYRAGGLITDSTFFNFFDYKLTEGNAQKILISPDNIVLTESFAKRIFGDTNPIGKTIEIDQIRTYQVAGILKDIPSNSTISFDFIVPKHSQEDWYMSGVEFLLTNDSFDQTTFDEKIKALGRVHPQFKESILSTVAFSDIYFNNNLETDLLAKKGDVADIKTMILVAIVILIISILNFTNMQSTLMFSQLKNRGIKQVHGAKRVDFLLELLASRSIFTITSILLISGLFMLFKPNYLRFLELSLHYSSTQAIGLIAIGTIIFLILTTLISLIQSSKFSSTKALAGQLNISKRSKAGKVLTTVQYVFAIVLIISSGVIYKQFMYMQNKDLGFDSKNLVSIKFFDQVAYTDDFEEFRRQSLEQRKSYEYVKNELIKFPGVKHFTQGNLPIDGSINGMPWKLSNSSFDYRDIKLMVVDPNYLSTLDLKVLKGRFFTDSLDRERQHKVVINKAAMRFWDIKNLDEAKLASSAWRGEKDPWQVIGVVDDFNFEHLSRKIEPLIMVYFQDSDKNFNLKINQERFKPTLEAVSALFQEIYPDGNFTYTVLENQLEQQYEHEKQLSQTFILFTIVALILSSIGLFTMALYETQKRIKEIGIRKVVGASAVQIITLLSGNFIKWVLLAFIIAAPIAWYAMDKWLANFANQTNLNWWIFASAGFMVTLLALVTVIGQSLMAARRNPVQSLRHE